MVGKSTKKKRPGRKAAAGERREFLVHLDPRLIKGLKLAALKGEVEVTASEVLETALREWLDGKRIIDDEREGVVEKRQFLAKISVRVIKNIKLAAMDRHVTASVLVAIAVTEWLARADVEGKAPNRSSK